MKDASSQKRRRRRSCYDRLRMHMIERRRTRHVNPAQSAALQLLALFSFALRRASSTTLPPPRYVAPPMSPRHAQRLDLARRLDVAPRYVDIVLSQGAVPYARLFEDVRRGGIARRDAMSELRKRVPEASVDWLNHIERWNLWSELLKRHARQDTEEDTEVYILTSTLAWLDQRASKDDSPSLCVATPGVDGGASGRVSGR